MLIWILKIASIPPIERLLCRLDDRCPCGFRLLHHQVDFFFTADIVSKGKIRRTWGLNREVGVVSKACSWPKSKLHPVLQLKEDDRSVLEFVPDDSLRWQTKTVSIAR